MVDYRFTSQKNNERKRKKRKELDELSEGERDISFFLELVFFGPLLLFLIVQLKRDRKRGRGHTAKGSGWELNTGCCGNR